MHAVTSQTLKGPGRSRVRINLGSVQFIRGHSQLHSSQKHLRELFKGADSSRVQSNPGTMVNNISMVVAVASSSGS